MRLRIGVATLECATLTIAPAELDAEQVADLVGATLPALLASGLVLLLTTGQLGQYQPLGMAPYRLQSSAAVPTNTGVVRSGLRLATNADRVDLQALHAAYPAYLREDRSIAEWRVWPRAETLWVLEDGRGRVAGYACIEVGQVIEAVAADAGVARLLLAGLAQQHAQATLALSPNHPVMQAAIQLGAQLIVQRDQRDLLPLAGVLDLAGILTQIAPELIRRLADSRYAGWSGNLSIELIDQRVVLGFRAGQPVILAHDAPADLRLRRVTLPGLAQLLLGYRGAADLRATGELQCDDTALGLFDTLFPICL
jgi:hypothetical protein